MAWYPVTLDEVRAVVAQSRLKRAIDPVTDGELVDHFRVYQKSVVAAIRDRIANAHPVDSDDSLLPAAFTMLAALRIAAIFLGRPGIPANADQAVFELSQGQKDELTRLEAQLEKVAEGDVVSAPDDPIEDSQSDQPTPSISEKTLNWSRDNQDGIGAYG